MIQKKERKNKTITFRTNENIKESLAKMAKKHGISVSDLVDQIVSNYVNNEVK